MLNTEDSIVFSQALNIVFESKRYQAVLDKDLYIRDEIQKDIIELFYFIKETRALTEISLRDRK